METEIKSGLEIHQQLDSHKLFCECPSVLRNDEPSIVVKRKLHAVKGESGEIDIAARHEAEKDKEFIYHGYDTTCLVELDEEPPHLINQEALRIALHIALLLNCEIMPVSQIMRKTVIDGSNTSGFQRTVLIARNGFVETSHGKVRIKTLFLEEDACRPANNKNEAEISNQKIWKLDRLGIPLVEIATEPDIKSAEQAKETALHIGDILRSCKVKRGIGTIRQDVNVSIAGHPRVEIKGFQDVKMFISVIEREIKRQEENIKLKKELRSEVRNAHEDGTTSFLRPMPGSARMYPETDLPLLYISRDIINEAKKTLPKLRGEIREGLKHKGLSEEMIRLLVSENKIEEFEALLKIIPSEQKINFRSDSPSPEQKPHGLGVDGNFIVKTMILIPRDIASHEKIPNIDEILTLDIIESILHAIVNGKIKKEDVKNVMEKIAKGKSFDESIKIEKIDLGEIEEEIAKIVREKPGLSIGGYMGLIMQKFKGKINGKDATDVLKKLLK